MLNREQYLDLMGIDQWQLRSSVESGALQVIQRVPDGQWLFVIDKQEALVAGELAWQSAPLQLLQAILTAIKETTVSVSLICYDSSASTASLTENFNTIKNAVILGEINTAVHTQLKQKVGNAQWIQGKNLTQLAQNPQAKRALWLQLKQCQ